jgi:hypothetical protein
VSVIFHLSDEAPSECPACGGHTSLGKLVSNFTTSKRTKSSPRKVGDIAEEFIKDARHDLQKQKQELDRDR